MSRGRIINNILLDYLIIYIYRREKQKVYLKTFAFYLKGLYICLGIDTLDGGHVQATPGGIGKSLRSMPVIHIGCWKNRLVHQGVRQV